MKRIPLQGFPFRKHCLGRMLAGLLCLLFGFPLNSSAWEGWVAFREAAQGISAIEAEFTQKKTLPILSKPLLSTGRFYYQPPRSLRWEYERPVQSVLVMGGGSVKRYFKEKGEWLPDSSAALSAMQMVLEEITQWQRGRFDASPHFRAELLEGDDPKVVVVPKEEAWKKVIRRIELTPDENRPGVIRSVQMIEDERTFTILDFTQIRLNGKLPAALFEKVP